MSHSKVVRFAVSTLVAGLASAAVASPPAQSNANNPEGSWLLTVSFPAQGTNPPLSFKEIVTLHAGGTLTETNSTLNAASGVLGFAEGGFGLIGSGLFIANPPHVLHDTLQPLMQVLVDILGQYDGAHYLLEQCAA